MNVSIARGLSPALALAAGLAGCSGQQAGGALTPAAASAMRLSSPAGSAQPDGTVQIFTANRDHRSILAFRATASGNVTPTVRIAGSNTTLHDPDSLAFDASGNVYAADDGGNRVAVFGPGANGNVKPTRMLGGSKSQLGPTEGLLVDPFGNLWVSDYANNAITDYPPGAHGNVPPSDVISGSKTQLNVPTGMAWNTSGSGALLYVANASGASIVGFGAGAAGNAAPVVSISGSKTGLSRPFALTFDSTGRLLVADENAGVLIFAPGANGNVAPAATISPFSYADGIVTDAHDNIYVADFTAKAIEEFPSYANGYWQPIRTIHGHKTTLDGPNFLVLR
jgi:sugar lactone lactonase YvrE